MEISSNELFHFTKLEYLKNILKEKAFYPRYNLEFIHFSKNKNKQAALWAIPMVCFCDIPYNLSNLHRKRYGNVGIVMSEKWKLKNKLNPVIYVQSESYLAEAVSNLNGLGINFNSLYNKHNEEPLIIDTLNITGKNLNYLSYFIKQFENKKELTVDYKIPNNILKPRFEKRRFYDEREWRYIPFQLENKGRDYIHMNIEEYNNPKKLEEANELVKNFKLNFEITDIEYIVVETEKDYIKLESFLKNQDFQEIFIKQTK